jgi:hypothetical protein
MTHRLPVSTTREDASVSAFLEALWPVLDHTIRLVARGKLALTITSELLADARAEVLARAPRDQIAFQAPSPAGTRPASHRVIEHWLELTTVALGPRLVQLLATHGLRREDWPSIDTWLTRSPHAPIVGLGGVLSVIEGDGAVVTDEGPSAPKSPSPKERAALERARRDGTCACPLCESLRKAIPAIDVDALVRQYAEQRHAESLRIALSRAAVVRDLHLAGRRDLDGALLARLGELTALESLDLSRTRVDALPETIGRLRRLARLQLSDTPLGTLPSSLGETALDTLVATSSALRALPASLARAPLRTLRLGFLRTPAPDGFLDVIASLSQLEHIELFCGTSHTLPDAGDEGNRILRESATQSEAWARALESFDFSRLPALQGVHLSGFPLTHLPPSLAAVPALRHLDVRGAPLRAIDVDLRKLPLEHLQLEGVSPTLPDWLGEITTLRHLSIHGRFTDVPEAIFGLRSLQGLGLGGRYSRLPDRFDSLPSLKDTWLHSVALDALPPTLARLPRLELLALQSVPRARELADAIGVPNTVRVVT